MSKSELISGKEIYQASLVHIDEHVDSRGSFAEVFQKSWGTVVEPVQWSIVKSAENVLRGMHFHKRHDEYFSLIQGHCLVGLKDMRSDSPTSGNYSLYELFEDDMAGIAFPAGVIHGWYFYTPSIHLQGVSESYIDYHKDDNHGCQWNSADLDIPWPMDDPIVSNRSEGFTTTSESLKFSDD